MTRPSASTTDTTGSARSRDLALSIALALATLALLPASAAAGPLVTSFSAGVLVDENVAKPETSDYATQAGSTPEVAFTKFTLDTSQGSAEEARVDLPAGLSVNPQATPQCSEAGTKLASCPASSRVGTATVTIANVPLLGKQTVSGAVYNMVPPAGAPADFAFEVTVGLLFTVRTDLVGGLRWHPSNGQPGDYGEYFTISGISNTLGTALEKSELVFWGDPAKHNGGGAPEAAFLRNPTTCAGPQTTYIYAKTYSAASGHSSYTTPVGAGGCASEPFAPTVAVTPSTTQRDTPDGLTADVHLPQDQTPSHIATAHLESALVTLPAGLTLNPAAANGLQACTDAGFHAGVEGKVECPAASEAGTVEITTPVLPAALTGKLYVGEPHEGNPYRVFLDAESETYGVAVRLVGSVTADPVSGRLTTSFPGDPQLPFTDLKLKFKTGAGALFANPLTCGSATTTTVLTPYSGTAAATPASAFTVDVNGAGGACPPAPAFAPVASATPSSTVAAAYTNLSLSVTRTDGEQTLSAVSLRLPEGMLAKISEGLLCQEPAAAQGTCPASSEIGTVTVAAGAGPSPLSLGGKAFLTRAHGAGQFGLSIVVPAVAGPYNLGTVVVRAAVAVDTVDGQVTITSDPLPTILQGIPLRLRSLLVAVNKQSELLLNPAYCTATAITGSISSTAAQSQPFSSPLQDTGCGSLPFAPEVKLTPSTTRRDSPLGLGLDLLLAPKSADLRGAVVGLPAGLSLNPSVASGLQACTDAQLGVGSSSPVACPPQSAIGTVRIDTPLLPTPLTGSLYVGVPLSTNPESGQEYRLFLDAENAAYGVGVRLIGAVAANAATGQLTVSFEHTPPIPFSDLILSLDGGPHAPLASAPACGTAQFATTLTPSTGSPASPAPAYVVDDDGAKGACPATLPFSLAQATQDRLEQGSTPASFTLTLSRADGQQFLSSVRTALPPGLLGRIAAVSQCPPEQAASGSCPASSRIGNVLAELGTGEAPLQLPGSVYLTGPYGNAPYGLAFAVPAHAVGPYDFGTVVARARIAVDEQTARVTVTTDPLPTIVGGAPLRLRALTVTVGEGFLVNPTNCSATATETLLTSTLAATQSLSTTFQPGGCAALPFGATLSAATSASFSRAEGAALQVQLSYPGGHEANLAAVSTSLPPQLAARLTTLQKACPEATFAGDPAACPGPSRVGQASVQTPLLGEPLSGPAYLVSNGGAAFPDLDIVLSGDGLRLLLHGRTNISAGVTSATFAALPDVPFSRFLLTLPQGPYSLLAATAALCGETLAIGTTLTAQNGARSATQTRIAVAGCPAGSGGAGSISHLRVAPARFKAAARGATLSRIAPPPRRRRGRARVPVRRTGADITWTDSQAARVVLTVSRPLKGALRGRRCVAQTGRRRRRRGRSCTLYKRLGAFSHADSAGADGVHFSGRLNGRKLPPGRYRLEASAVTAAGALGAPLVAVFQVARG